MKIKRETDHATKCIIYLSKLTGRNCSVQEISNENNIPRSFLAKILQKLEKADLVRSQQGNQGGFQLSRPASQINLYEVYFAIQGGIEVNRCVIDRKACDKIKFCSVHPIWLEIQNDIQEKLSKTNIEELQKKESEMFDSLIENGIKTK